MQLYIKSIYNLKTLLQNQMMYKYVECVTEWVVDIEVFITNEALYMGIISSRKHMKAVLGLDDRYVPQFS